jgi:hypothetical protein
MPLKLGDPPGATRDSIRDMLREICPEADWQVTQDGTVAPRDPGFCESPMTREAVTQSPAGCRCICSLVESAKTITVTVVDDLSSSGGGRTIPASWDDYSNGTGSDATVNIENRNRYRQRRPDSGDWIDVPDWIILAHELCGHALPTAKGDHREARPGKPGYKPDWHRQSEQAEDAIRQARGLPLRGTNHGLKP